MSWSRETSYNALICMNSCFNGWKGKIFWIVVWPAMKSGYITITLIVEDHWVSSAMHHLWRQRRISMALIFCSTFGGIKWAWFIMSCLNRRKWSRDMTVECNWCIWVELWRKMAAIRSETKQSDFATSKRLTSCTKTGQNPLGNAYMVNLQNPPYSSSIDPSDYHLLRSIARGPAKQHFYS